MLFIVFFDDELLIAILLCVCFNNYEMKYIVKDVLLPELA